MSSVLGVLAIWFAASCAIALLWFLLTSSIDWYLRVRARRELGIVARRRLGA